MFYDKANVFNSKFNFLFMGQNTESLYCECVHIILSILSSQKAGVASILCLDANFVCFTNFRTLVKTRVLIMFFVIKIS